jgi:hypothetical protein
MAQKDKFTRNWIIQNSIEVVSRYEEGILTIRGLHYQLVGLGMTNSMQHYKRVVAGMIEARWKGSISFEAFSDHDREVLGETDSKETTVEEKFDYAVWAINHYVKNYRKNRWENQYYVPEVWIEKKALQGVFQKPCNEYDVALAPCKGYPSLTFLNEAKERFQQTKNEGKTPIILYFGDYDPSGEDIPRSIEENFTRFGCPVEVRRFALMEEQVVAWNLPPAPAKVGDSRTANWGGLGQVELDAVEPKKLMNLCRDAIREFIDPDLFEDLKTQEAEEKIEYIERIQKHVTSMEF